MTKAEHLKRIIEASNNVEKTHELCATSLGDGRIGMVSCMCALINPLPLQELIDWYNIGFGTDFTIAEIEKMMVLK